MVISWIAVRTKNRRLRETQFQPWLSPTAIKNPKSIKICFSLIPLEPF